MKVLLTGGSGFIASYYYEPLAAIGADVVNLDLVDPSPQAKSSQHAKGDIRDDKAVADAMAGCDAVVHLAAAHHDFGITPETFEGVNTHGAEVICKAMDANGITDCVFYSTVAVYGDAKPPLAEDTHPEPFNPYGETKLSAEGVFKKWTEQGGGRRCLVIRPTVTFGPRNFANMYSLIRQVHSGKFIKVGKGENIKSLSYVENIVDATMYLWSPGDKANSKIDDGFHVFNYIDKPDLTSDGITNAVYKALGKKPPKFRIPLWFALMLALPFDIVIKLTGKNLPISGARVRKLFSAQTKFEADKLAKAGYTPKVPLEEGIRRMVQWYLEEGKDQQAVWHIPPETVGGEPPKL